MRTKRMRIATIIGLSIGLVGAVVGMSSAVASATWYSSATPTNSSGNGEVISTASLQAPINAGGSVSGSGSWKSTDVISGTNTLYNISCAGSAGEIKCMAVGSNSSGGGIITYWAPDISGWAPASISGTEKLLGISCPSTSMCMAVGTSNPGEVAIELLPPNSSHPMGSWGSPNTISNVSLLSSVSCPSTNMCMAVGTNSSGGVAVEWNATTSNPSGSWGTPIPISGTTNLSSVSCPSTSMCMVVGDTNSGVASVEWNATTSNPSGSWGTPIPISGTTNLSSVSCPSTSMCMAVGTNSSGGVAVEWNATTSNPSGSWGTPIPISGTTNLSSVSCPLSTPMSMCMAVGTNSSGGVAVEWNATTSNPSGSWGTPIPISGTTNLSSVSCATSTSMCMAVGTNNSGEGVAAEWNWAISTMGTESNMISLNGVSCPSTSMCWAVGSSNSGGVAVEWNATISNPSGSWGTPIPVSGTFNLSNVSCATSTSASVCWAVGQNSFGEGVAAEWNGSSWNVPIPGPEISQLFGVSCPSTSMCMAVGWNNSGEGVAAEWTASGGWGSPNTISSVAFSDVSCPSTSMCMAMGSTNSGIASVEWNATTSNPSGSWGTPIPVSGAASNVSCPSTSMCMAVGICSTGVQSFTW